MHLLSEPNNFVQQHWNQIVIDFSPEEETQKEGSPQPLQHKHDQGWIMIHTSS